jgi:DNA polymerase-3 subunit epsilon
MRFALIVAAATVFILVLVGALLLALWLDLDTRERDLVGPIVGQEVGLAIGSGLLLAALLAIALAAFLGRYARPARRLSEETAVIAEANPDHRVEREGAAELRELAEAINRLAERHGQARRDVEQAVARGRADVEQERNRLAAVMSELAHAVLVCDLQGRILLHNGAARTILGGEGEGRVGLGRSVFGLLDRNVVGHAIDGLRYRLAETAEQPMTRFVAPAGARLVRCGMTPVRDSEGVVAGFVLSAEDVTSVAGREGRRDHLLRVLGEETRAAVASIRAAVESMLDYDDLDSEQRGRFLRIVEEEAVRLSERVDDALTASADLVEAELTFDEMRGSDLLAALQRRLEELLVVEVEEGEDEGLWLTVDSYSLVRSLEVATQHLQAGYGVEKVWVGIGREGSQARLDLRWAGPHLDADALRTWEEGSVPESSERLSSRVREVLARHGAEAWSTPESGGRAVLRVLLPLAASHARPPPARAPAPAYGSRPTFYDFDLFSGLDERSPLDARPLQALAYTVFDTETTGLDPAAGDELVAVGAVRIAGGRLLSQEVFDQLIDPGRTIPQAAVSIHGISGEMVRGEPSVEKVLPRFARFVEETVLVGHDVAFDMSFFHLNEQRTGVRLRQPVLDTLLLDAVANPDREDHSLEAMAELFGVSVIGRHTALGDAILTAELFLRLIPVLRSRGVETLGEARSAARRTREAHVSRSIYARG